MTNNQSILNLKSLDGELGEEVIVLKEQVEKFCKKEVAPLAEKIDIENAFPHQLWKKLGNLGVLGVTVPDEFGGLSLGYLEHAVIMEEISTFSASIGLSYGAHSNLCVNQIKLNGSALQKKKYLPNLVSGDYVGALAMSETEAGSDVVSMKLKAETAKDGFILNGRKMWITNGPEADVLVVYAKTEPELGSKGITAFLIEKTFKGFSTAQKLDKLGMRGSNTCELIFEDCFVPKENILGELNSGVKVLMSGLDFERVVLAAGPLGIMKACLNLVLPYVRERKQFGKAIGEFELIQGKLADMYTSYVASRSLVHSVARACDRGESHFKESLRKDAAAAILYAAECGTKCALDAVQILGGNGYTNDYPAGRYLRDAKLYEIGAGTSEIRRMLIGRELFNSK